MTPTAAAAGDRAAGLGPYDTPFGAGTRFLVEVAAWTLGTRAAWVAWGPVFGVLALVVLVGSVSIFNAKGDKNHDGVLVPGHVRFVIELSLGVVAVVAAGTLWGVVGVAALGTLVVVAGWAGRRRAAWLLGLGGLDA